MFALLASRLLAAVALLVVIPLVAWTVSGGPLDVMSDAISSVQPSGAPTQAGKHPTPAHETPSPGAAVRAVARPLAAVVASVGLALVPVLAALVVLVVWRLHRRRSRVVCRHWLLPYRADEAAPEALEALYRAWHEQLAVRWWQRLLWGQPALTLEIHAVERRGEHSLRLLLGCPDGMAEALAGPLNACYPGARLVPREPARLEFPALVRLRKRYRFVRRLATPERHEGAPIVDGVLATLGGLGTPAVLQLALTPVPASFDYVARSMLRARERQLERARARDLAAPGARSRAAELELEGGQETQWKPLWFCDLRIAAESRAVCRAVGGALQAASAENRLRERRMVLRRELYLSRMTRGLGNPLPGWIKNVVSTSELAMLYQLPSPALRSVAFERSSVPRAIAPPQVLRPAGRVGALGRDDRGYVALHQADLEKNLALIGQIGSGKTSVLARTTERDAHDPDCCVIVIDPNSTGVGAHLSAVPAGRTVHLLDVAEPECGFNPLLASGAVSKVADDLVEAFVDVHDTGEILTSSRQFLGGAVEAVIGAHRHGALDHDPSLWDLYRVLLPNQSAFRSKLLDAIAHDRELLGAATLLGEDIPQGLRDIGAQYALRMSAPRNKLFQMRSRNIDRVLRHPHQLSLREIIDRREVLIVDGRMGSTGVQQTRVLVMFLLNLVFAELRRQLERPADERVRVCLKLDEGHLVMGEHFATALSTLRAAGLEATLCYQYSAQLRDEMVRAGAASLLASRCVFQLSEAADAEEMTKLTMSAYASSVRDDPEARARMGITPDAIMHLPRHWAVCSWQAGGARVPAFVMNTLPLREDHERIAQHRARQRERGGSVPDVLPHPLKPVKGEQATRDPLDDLERLERETGQGHVDEETRPGELERLIRANGTPEPRPQATAHVARTAPTVGKPTATGPKSAPAARTPAAEPAATNDDDHAAMEREQAAVLAAVRAQIAQEAGPRAPAGAVVTLPTKPRAIGHTTRWTNDRPERSAVPERVAEKAHRQRDRGASSRVQPPAEVNDGHGDGAPETYLEVQIEPTSLTWDDTPIDPIVKAPKPEPRQLEVLGTLHRLGPLLASQIGREFFPGVTERSVQRSLAAMRRAGWVRRFRLRESHGRGQPKYVYVLDRRGFDLAREIAGPRGTYIDREAKFVDRRFDSVLKPLHDLHANAVLFALLHHAPAAARGWKGPGEGVLHPPRRRPRNEPDRPVRADELPLESPLRLSGLQLDEFASIRPDVTLELALKDTRPKRRFDLLIELDRTSNPRADSNTRKLLRYDALLSGWHVLLDRYRATGHSPIVVVVCQDDPAARRWAQTADALLTGRLARMGDPPAEARFPGRRRLFFATELDLHRGLLRGYRVPAAPPDVRHQLEGARAARKIDLEHLTFLPEHYLR